jgi:transcriptional regulator of acetoin/glycerol metabolism
MEWLVEHGWPGNEVELDTVLLRAALSMQPGSPVLTRADLLRSGFRPLPSSPAPGQGRDA